MFRYARENDVDISREEMDEKLSIIGKDSNNVVRRVGDSGGGLYIISELNFRMKAGSWPEKIGGGG